LISRGRRFVVASALALMGLQLVQPEAPGPVLPGEGPISAHVEVPEPVDALLREACYDCHSGETRWPWYSRISPVSWLVVGHVKAGRSHLDFSRWSTDPNREPTPSQRLRWSCQEVRQGDMPPVSYRLAHLGAWLDEGEKEAICSWTREALRHVEAARGRWPLPPRRRHRRPAGADGDPTRRGPPPDP